MKRKLLILAALFALIMQANAQLGFDGKPKVVTEPLVSQSQQAVPTERLARIDNNKYILEDMQVDGKDHPYRLSVMQNVSISNKTHGLTTTLPSGDVVWRIGIKTEGAEHTFPIFSKFDIPEGAELFIYTPDRSFVIGGFNIENTNEDGGFYTQALPGDEFIVEYYEPAQVAGKGTLEISQVAHGYKPFLEFTNRKNEKILDNSSGSCEINVACTIGNNWADQKRSVVLMYMTYGGDGYMCTGTMINNTSNNKTNYMLSANHCIEDFSSLTSVTFTFYFNAQTSTCTGTSGNRSQSLTGATKLANYASSDFLLMRLNSSIPASYQVYYAGWSRSTSSLVGCCIHHPFGDWKKISIPRNVQAMSGSNVNFWYVSWKTGSSNQGCVERGSSGSALFNANKLVIGQLKGGSSDCQYVNYSDYMYDMYGRFDKSWTGGGTNATRLSNWLDPQSSGATSCQGLNYNASVGIEQASQETATMTICPMPSTGIFNIDIPDLGEASYTVYDMMGRIAIQARTVFSTNVHKINLSALPSGAYRLVVTVNGNRYTKPILIKK